MDEFSAEVIDRLCNLSPEEIFKCDPKELHRALVLATQQIENELRALGVEDDTLKDPKRFILKERVNKLEALDNRLQFLSNNLGL